MKGKMIVIYGINSLGKTLQAKKLVEFLIEQGISAEYLKYPVYDLEPTGPQINAYLRKGNPYGLSVREAQLLYTQNRIQYQPTLLKKLNSGVWIVAEDYIGTGLAWGGLEHLNFLMDVNRCLHKEDLTILFDGERFSSGIEENHKHEEDEKGVYSARKLFLQLAQAGGWTVINSNQDEQSVHALVRTAVMLEFAVFSSLFKASQYK